MSLQCILSVKATLRSEDAFRKVAHPFFTENTSCCKPAPPTRKPRAQVRNGRVCDNLNLSRALGDFNYKDFSKPAAERVPKPCLEF